MIARPALLLAAGAVAAAGGLLTLRDGDDGAGTGAAAAGGVVAVDGAAVFQAKGCATCHDGPDGAAPVGVGPPHTDGASWAAARVAGTSAEESVRQSIVAPQSVISPAVVDAQFMMPVLPIAPEELDALVAYLLAERAG